MALHVLNLKRDYQLSRPGTENLINAWMDDSFRFYGDTGGCDDDGGRTLGGNYFYKSSYPGIWSSFRRVSSDELCSRTRLKDPLAGA
jgi:hypothetical protein